MISHVLKHHVPMDQVPFSCSLCMFRCQEQKTLVEHIRKYNRHVEAELKLGFQPNYTEILNKSANPHVIGDSDMVQLDREESYRWHGRHTCRDSDDHPDDVFDDDDDDTVNIGGLVLPGWAAEDPADTRPCAYPTISIQDWEHTTFQPGLQLSTSTVSAPVLPSAPAHVLPSASAPAVPAAFDQVVPSIPDISRPAILSTPGITLTTPGAVHLTPQDEYILPSLLRQGEGNQIPTYRRPSTAGPVDQMDDEDEEPLAKRPRTAEDSQIGELSKAITAGFEKLVMALDNNTRVLRNQGQTFEKAVAELSRIERKLSSIERVQASKLKSASDKENNVRSVFKRT